MRGLQFGDVFRFSEIIDKMGIEVDLNNLVDKFKGETNIQAKVGGQIGLLLVKKIHKAEREVYKFIAEIEEKTIDEIKKYGFKDLIGFFNELVSQEDFADFFQKAEVEEPKI